MGERAGEVGAQLPLALLLRYHQQVVSRVPEPGGPVPQRLRAREPAEPLAGSVGDLEQASDEALALALIAKQAHAEHVLWLRFAPLARRIVRRTLGPASEAEDLVQDVFMQLFLKVHTLREPRALKAFIISVTTLTLRRELRRRKLRSWLGLRPDPLAGDLRVVHPDPVGRAALERFYALLDGLHVRDRTAFALRYIEGMPLNEVAAALGVSLATAKRCLARAQRRVLLLVERDPLLADYLTPAFGGEEHG